MPQYAHPFPASFLLNYMPPVCSALVATGPMLVCHSSMLLGFSACSTGNHAGGLTVDFTPRNITYYEKALQAGTYKWYSRYNGHHVCACYLTTWTLNVCKCEYFHCFAYDVVHCLPNLYVGLSIQIFPVALVYATDTTARQDRSSRPVQNQSCSVY